MESAVWFQTIVLLVTACFVCWYTIETARLRREMVRQNQITLRPVVVPLFEKPGADHVFKLKNIGAAAAFNVRVEPLRMEGPDPISQTNISWETRFDPVSFLASGETALVPFQRWDDGKQSGSTWLADIFRPAYCQQEITLTILFEDVEEGGCEEKINIKPGHGTSAAPSVKLRGIHKLPR